MAPLLRTFHTSPYKGSGVKGQELSDCYHGDVVDGLRHGRGTYVYANGFFTYEGHYVDGAKHGEQGCRPGRVGMWVDRNTFSGCQLLQ